MWPSTLSINQLAAVCAVRLSQARRWVRSGVIKPIRREGRSFQYSRDDAVVGAVLKVLQQTLGEKSPLPIPLAADLRSRLVGWLRWNERPRHGGAIQIPIMRDGVTVTVEVGADELDQICKRLDALGGEPAEPTLVDETPDELSAAVRKLRDVGSAPELRQQDEVRQAPIQLAPTVAKAQELVKEIHKRNAEFQPLLRQLDAVRWDRVVMTSGTGRRAQVAARIERLIASMFTVATRDLEELPARVASLKLSNVREKLPDTYRQTVTWSSGIPQWMDETMAEIKKLVQELANGPGADSAGTHFVRIVLPAPPPAQFAEADFNPFE